MVPLPPVDRREFDHVVSYSVGEEEMGEAIVNAFHAAHIDVFEMPTRLVDWINPDVLESIRWTADRPIYVSARIWDHRVAMTADEVRVYATADQHAVGAG